jgi:hypothetical protein
LRRRLITMRRRQAGSRRPSRQVSIFSSL